MPRKAHVGKFGQPVKVTAVILVGEETRLTVVAPLDQVKRYARKGKTRTARHGDSKEGKTTARIAESRGLSPITC